MDAQNSESVVVDRWRYLYGRRRWGPGRLYCRVRPATWTLPSVSSRVCAVAGHIAYLARREEEIDEQASQMFYVWQRAGVPARCLGARGPPLATPLFALVR